MIVNGGLETMNLMCQLYISPGDVIIVESPTFVHCVEGFEMFQAKCVAAECEDTCCAGWAIMIDEETLEKYKELECELLTGWSIMAYDISVHGVENDYIPANKENVTTK